ncbi:hypothetical protein [Rhizobium rhizogenes]|uniref:hypothetical protein n=1 Tax=Rhizobium rhizogenes TaxID=359 RepID=UPI0004D95939|nr:hypothetical protein [Rhizobium rhizogenes]KEA07463.1 hypothetical protein CN09_11155 [Rhizobium rhizogenes]NTJ22268.1 hypothetical protein [Rhizobium rhizogenes]QUE80986.1 hypothetical protein EML492_04020 [Rhizobium rhizogenes]TQO80910.1 hypothetical protein FFE80_07380 [Rhizobium rhizogenes]TRB51504.1 hypothetical protein EXN69_26265 [Rhizobium rhizogenes]
MTAAITLWLGFVLSIGAITWFGTRRQAVAFTVVSVAMGFLSAIPLGHAAPWQPTKGQYKVLGARIDVDKAIYILVDTNPEPRFYKLPYSKETAGDLQNAQDAADAHGSSVTVTIGGSAAGFAEGTERNREPPKPAEPPALVTQ